MMADGVVVSRAIEGVPDPEGKFKMYADYSEPASKIPSHRMLAIRRGAKEGILSFEIELDKDTAAGVAARAGDPRARRVGPATSKRPSTIPTTAC